MLIPKDVWYKVTVDYLGLFPNEKYIFVAIDQRFRFPEVESTSAGKLLNTVDPIFSTDFFLSKRDFLMQLQKILIVYETFTNNVKF